MSCSLPLQEVSVHGTLIRRDRAVSSNGGAFFNSLFTKVARTGFAVRQVLGRHFKK